MSSNSRLYRIYINDLEFPIAPHEILTKPKLKNRLLDIIDGEYTLIKKRGLTDFELDVRLPLHTDMPYVTAQAPLSQQYYLTYLEELVRQELAFEWTVIRPDLPSTNNLDSESNVRLATLEDYEIYEAAENNGDIILRLKLKQYIPLTVDTTVLEEDRTEGVLYEHTEVDGNYYYGSFRNSEKHELAMGDTAESIAIKHGITLEQFLEYNAFETEKDLYKLDVGTILNVSAGEVRQEEQVGETDDSTAQE